jgi:tetratricopeptide (TPR) repeat protein
MALNFNTISPSPIFSGATIPKRFDKYDIEKHLDEYVVVWLKEGGLNTDIEFELRQLINCIHVYEKEENCLKYIHANSKEKIFLILSDSIAERFVSKIHNLDQIQFIYIFCEYFLRYFICNSLVKIEKHKQWIKNYSKIVNVYDDKSKLFSKLQENAQLLSISTIPITIFNLSSDEKSIRKFNKENATFMWFYIIIEVLLRMPDKSTSKTEMINECRLCYENDLIEQEKIRDFEENYSFNEAISWYTRDSFLFRTLNKALRTENIDIIYKFRFFLIDLLNQLKSLHSEFMELLNDMILTVYRGGSLSVNELENVKNNIGGLISFNTFLSTSFEKDVALLFAGEGGDRPLRESVLFQIKISTQNNLKPFANIKTKSFMKDEDEVLFSLGTIFRIESVENLNENIWLLNLTLTTDEDQQLQVLRKYLQERLDQTSSIHDLGDFLYKIGDYDRAENYYRLLLNKYPPDHRDLVMVYCNLGVLQHCKDNYREAYNYFTTAFLVLANSLPFKNDRDRMDFATISYNSACSIAKFQGYREALRMFKDTINHIQKQIRTAHPSFINMYNGYALANAYNGFHGVACFYHSIALAYAETRTPVNQFDLANTYHSMGLTYKSEKDYSRALDFFQKSLNIRQLCLPNNHPDLADVLTDIAHIYNHQGHEELALQTFNKVLEIYLKSHLINYSRIIMVYVAIGNVYRNNGHYDIAIEKYNKALELIETNSLEHSTNLIKVYMNIGVLYECQHLHSEALIYLEKAASTVKNSWSKVQLDLAIIYNHIGMIHYKDQNHQLGIEYLKKCLDIRLKFLPSTHPDVIVTQEDISKYTIEMEERKKEVIDSSLHPEKTDKIEVTIQQNILAITDTSSDQPLDLRIRKRVEDK